MGENRKESGICAGDWTGPREGSFYDDSSPFIPMDEAQGIQYIVFAPEAILGVVCCCVAAIQCVALGHGVSIMDTGQKRRAARAIVVNVVIDHVADAHAFLDEDVVYYMIANDMCDKIEGCQEKKTGARGCVEFCELVVWLWHEVAYHLLGVENAAPTDEQKLAIYEVLGQIWEEG